MMIEEVKILTQEMYGGITFDTWRISCKVPEFFQNGNPKNRILYPVLSFKPSFRIMSYDHEISPTGQTAGRSIADRSTLSGIALPAVSPLQRKENNTGLPDNLKKGAENLSGYSLDDVKVHYNSDKPSQLQAHAYAQGTDIHIGAGQEQHLPHETWHVVQQKQGRVAPTQQLNGVAINDNAHLETEASIMGAQAVKAS